MRTLAPFALLFMMLIADARADGPSFDVPLPSEWLRATALARQIDGSTLVSFARTLTLL
jgi:hypothetical protein